MLVGKSQATYCHGRRKDTGSKLQPWADAQTVGPPLIRYLKKRKYHGEVTRKDQKDIVEAFSALRALNKSWYLEVTGYIQKLSVSGAQQLEQLPKSLLGSLAHVKSLALKETEELDFDKVEADWELAFDELFEKGSVGITAAPSIIDVLNAAANIQMLSLDFFLGQLQELKALIPMASVKTLKLTAADSLVIVQKFPNLENLMIDSCGLQGAGSFKHTPRIRCLSISTPEDLYNIFKNRHGFVRWMNSNPSRFDQSLLDGLANLTELTHLIFYYWSSDWCTHYHALCETLGGLKNLKVLSLFMKNTGNFRGWGLGDQSKDSFLNALPPSLRELDLWCKFSVVDHRVLMKATSLDLLEKLAFGYEQGVLSSSDLEWMTKLPKLVELSLWGRSVAVHAFAQLRNLPKLRRLVLYVENIHPEAFQQLRAVGDNVKQIVIWYRYKELKNIPMVLTTKQLLEARGVEVTYC